MRQATNAPIARTPREIPIPRPAFAPVLSPDGACEAISCAFDEEDGTADVEAVCEGSADEVAVDDDAVVLAEEDEAEPFRTRNPGLESCGVSAL
jgi:hypothetical protein